MVYGRRHGGLTEIGRSSDRQITRRPFSEVYREYPGRLSYLTLDVGLVTLTDATAWTSNTYGLPAPGPLADVYEQNLSLDVIDRLLVASGSASGVIRGTIKALFYRYRSVGGYDYVSDFLIAPAGLDAVSTQPGDSGMIWHLAIPSEPLPDWMWW